MKNVKQFTQAYSQVPWRKQVQILGLFLLVVLFSVMAAGIHLNLNARAVAYGRQILILQEMIKEKELERADLETQLGIITSPAYLEKRAIEMGFEPVNKGDPIYLVVPGYIDQPPTWIAPPPQPVEKIYLTLPPDFSESLTDWLMARVFSFLTPLLGAQP